MKVGILTFHRAPNPGAFWQAYALQKTLRGLGHEVVILDYQPKRHAPRSRIQWMHPGFWLAFRRRMENRQRVDAFRPALGLLSLSSPISCVNEINEFGLDAVVVGSDIVWNFHRPPYGGDRTYFGHGIKVKRLISYAASFGYVTPTYEVPDYVSSGLRHFRSISVRDKNSAAIVRNAIGLDPVVVLDPTLLQGWDDVGRLPQEREFVLVYANSPSSEEIKAIRDFVQKERLTTVGILYPQPWCDISKVGVSPVDWLGYVNAAKYVITATFHGTLFSIMLRKSFCVILNDAIRNKTEQFLGDLGLEARIVRGSRGIEAALATSANSGEVDACLRQGVNHSIDFLKSALHE